MSSRHDAFDLGDEFVERVEHRYETGRQRLERGDEWDQWYASLDFENSDLHHRKQRVEEGGDLYWQFQHQITANERVMVALEHNFDRLRAAEIAVYDARDAARDTRALDKRFGSRCLKACSWLGALGGLAILLCATLPNPAGFLIAAAVIGPLASIGFGVLSVLGGRRGSEAADVAAAVLRSRIAELAELREMVSCGEMEPRRSPSSRSTAVEVFPQPREGTGGEARV